MGNATPRRLAGLSVVVALLVLGGTTAAGAAEIDAGIDCFVTIEGPGSFYDFLEGPIPADYFGPGSDPFDGIISFQGVPLQPGTYGATDTIVDRPSGSHFGGSPPMAMIPTEIVELSLVSTEPVGVTSNGGTVESFFDVFFTISPTYASEGYLTLQRTDINDDGGTILEGTGAVDSFFDVAYEFTFVPVGGGTPVVWEDGDFIVLSYDVPWSHVPPDGVLVVPGESSNFFPGGTPGDPSVPPESLFFDGEKLHVEWVLTPEPATMSLLALGLGVLVARKRRR